MSEVRAPTEVDWNTIILDLFRRYRFPTRVGLVLRDRYLILDPISVAGCPLKRYRMDHQGQLKAKVEDFLTPQSCVNLAKRYYIMLVHTRRNRRDLHNRKILHRYYWKLLRDIQYHQKIGEIPPNFSLSLAWIQTIVYEYFPQVSLKVGA